MCCLPIIIQSTSGRADGCKNGTIAGLILEYTGEAAGQYRRVGYFWCGTDYLDAVAIAQPTQLTPTGDWPSHEQYSLENGYTISIV